MAKRTKYEKMITRFQKEVNAFPMIFAFSDRQMKEALKKLNVSVDDIMSIPNSVGYILKTDYSKWEEMINRQSSEIKEAMKDRVFAEGAFRYEMDNHEYAINWDGDSDVLSCFGYSGIEELVADGLLIPYTKARASHIEYMSKIGVI